MAKSSESLFPTMSRILREARRRRALRRQEELLNNPIDWVKTVYKPLTRRTARRVISGRLRDRRSPRAGRFTRNDVDELIEVAWHAYDLAAPDLPPQPTRGSTMNVHLACITLSLFDAILATGAEREYAIEFVADTTWAVYLVWARVASVVARFGSGKSSALAFAAHRPGDPPGAVSLSFPFNAPGYLIEQVAADKGVAFDVVRCPVGSYFREHDFALGELTNDSLVRTKTITQGNGRCDFRIVPKGDHPPPTRRGTGA
jgi:hypothetical protein